MAQFKAFDPKVEVHGAVGYGILNSIGSFRKTAQKIIEENGISSLKPDQWYPMQAMLNIVRAISERIGKNTVFLMGKKTIEYAILPQANSPEEALQSLDKAYHMNHRNGEIGHYHFEKTGMRSAKITSNTPYGCDYDMGVIQGILEKFAKPGDAVKLEHHNYSTCRKEGSEKCIYYVNW